MPLINLNQVKTLLRYVYTFPNALILIDLCLAESYFSNIIRTIIYLFIFLWHIRQHGWFDTKDFVVKKHLMILFLSISDRMRSFIPFLKCISPKVNVIVRLEFELTFYNCTVQHSNGYDKGIRLYLIYPIYLSIAVCFKLSKAVCTYLYLSTSVYSYLSIYLSMCTFMSVYVHILIHYSLIYLHAGKLQKHFTPIQVFVGQFMHISNSDFSNKLYVFRHSLCLSTEFDRFEFRVFVLLNRLLYHS